MALLKICILFVLIVASMQAPKPNWPNANSNHFRVQKILASVPAEGNAIYSNFFLLMNNFRKTEFSEISVI